VEPSTRVAPSDTQAMKPPPPTLDGARVLKAASLAGARVSGTVRHFIGGERVTDFAGIALAKYDDDPGVCVFYCDADWNVITDTFHADLADAEEQAGLEFDGLEWLARSHFST
jgi:hypothetical protein